MKRIKKYKLGEFSDLFIINDTSCASTNLISFRGCL